jgi:hypothetical protein
MNMNSLPLGKKDGGTVGIVCAYASSSRYSLAQMQIGRERGVAGCEMRPVLVFVHVFPAGSHDLRPLFESKLNLVRVLQPVGLELFCPVENKFSKNPE